MKLSKRLAAAFIAICMLLTVMPTFAATINKANDKMILPTDGTPVSIECSSSGNANNCYGLVITTASRIALGIDNNNITSRITVAGTPYDGLTISGKFAINRDHYHVNWEETSAASLMHYGEVTHFDFADLKVEAIRKANSGQIVLEATPQAFMDAIVPGTVKKVKPEALEREPNEEGIIQLTDEDFYTLTTEQEAELTGIASRVTDGSAHYDFTASAGYGYSVRNLTAKANEDYNTSVSYDSGVFPEGTIFIAASKLNANGATLKTDWSSTNYYAFPSFSSTSAPFGTYVAQETGDYYLYALKTHYSSSQSSRNTYADLNGVSYSFGYDDGPDALLSTKGWYWQRDSKDSVIKLTKDNLIEIVVKAQYNYSRSAGFALVPAEAAEKMEKIENWSLFSKTSGFSPEVFAELHDITTVDYVPADPITRTITVNGTAYEVSSTEADAVISVKGTDFDGVPIAGVTVADALVKAGLITDGSYLSKLIIKLNGIQIYEPDKFIVGEDDVITATAFETIDVTNFAPVKMSDVISLFGGSDGGLKLCFATTDGLNKSAISFAHDGSDYVDGALKDAKLVGYLEVVSEITKSYTNGDLAGTTVTIPVGGRAYVKDGYFDGEVVRKGTYGLQAYGLGFANAGTAPLHVTLPDGTVTQHPYYIQQSGYTSANMYITNSNTTNKVVARYIETTGKWQLFTDGGEFICITKYTVDENGNLVAVVSQTPEYLLLNKPLSVELKANERIMVWGYAPYAGAGTGGTTMVPLTGIIANPAN